MGRPMMHRKVQHNRSREFGSPDHLAAGQPRHPASFVAEFRPLEDAPAAGAPAPELRPSSSPVAPVSTGAQVQRESLKTILRELLDELLEERFRGSHTEVQGDDEQATQTPTAP